MIISGTLSKKIRQAREEKGLSMKDLAEKIGCSEQAIYNAETERRSVTAIMLYLISGATGRPLNWFFEDIEIKTEEAETQPDTDTINSKLDRIIDFIDRMEGK